MDLSDPKSGELLRPKYLDDAARTRCAARAHELGVTADQYRAWESGKRVPEVETAMLRERDNQTKT